MNVVEQLSEGIADSFRERKQNKIQRTFVKASDAAGAKIKGRTTCEYSALFQIEQVTRYEIYAYLSLCRTESRHFTSCTCTVYKRKSDIRLTTSSNTKFRIRAIQSTRYWLRQSRHRLLNARPKSTKYRLEKYAIKERRYFSRHQRILLYPRACHFATYLLQV